MKKQDEKTLPVRDTQGEKTLRDSVYGPRSVFDNAFDFSANIANDLYGPPPFYDEEFDPEQNFPRELYGPPPLIGRDEEKTIPVWDQKDGSDPVAPDSKPPFFPRDGFDFSANTANELYGPPPFFDEKFDPSEERPAPLYGPPPLKEPGEDPDPDPFFDPSEERPAPLYGPPRGLFGFFRRRH